MFLALSIVSRTDSLPRMSSSSCLLGASGKASSRLAKLSNELLPGFDCAFLASALFNAMTSFMLRGTLGVGGTTTSGAFDFTGVVARFTGVADDAADCVLGVLPGNALDFTGVDGGFRVREEDC